MSPAGLTGCSGAVVWLACRKRSLVIVFQERKRKKKMLLPD